MCAAQASNCMGRIVYRVSLCSGKAWAATVSRVHRIVMRSFKLGKSTGGRVTGL